MKLRFVTAAAGLAIALSALVPAASAQNSANPFAVRTVEVDGTGETRTSPDTADLDLAIDTQAKTAEEAAARNAALATKVIDALKAKLGDKGKTWTGGYSLNPEYADQSHPDGKPIIRGYTAQNTITVQTGALDLFGPLIDAAIAAGANRVNSLDFNLRDDTSSRNDAIARAAKDARSQAEALAAALDLKLGPIINASNSSNDNPQPVMFRANNGFAAAAMSTPVSPAEVNVSATVSLTYGIQ